MSIHATSALSPMPFDFKRFFKPGCFASKPLTSPQLLGHHASSFTPTMETAIRGARIGAGPPVQTTPRGEYQVEAPGGGLVVRQGDATGCFVKNILRPSQKRVVVSYLGSAYPISDRRACRTVRCARATYYYQSHRDPRIALRQRMREMAHTRVRYGYRKIRVLLNREGWAVGKHLVYRLYREEGLTLRHRPPRRRKAVVVRAHRPSVTKPNDTWTLDFVADQLANGQRFL